MVVDDRVDSRQTFRDRITEDVGLDIHEGQPVEVRQVVGRNGQDFEADRFDHGAIFRALDLAEGDQRRGASLASEQDAERVSAGDAVRVRVGLQQDSQTLARPQEFAKLGDPMEIREVRELVVEIVADQGF